MNSHHNQLSLFVPLIRIHTHAHTPHTDNLGASLSASDLHVLYERYGRDRDRDQDKIDFRAFCMFVDDNCRHTDQIGESAYV